MDQPKVAQVPGRREPQHAREEAWREIFREQARSGQSHSAFCRERSISLHSYFWYRRRLGWPKARRAAAPAPESPKLVPVRITTNPDSSPGKGAIEVVLAAGQYLRVSRGFDEETLLRLLRLLEGAC
jgi:hypothetical protein